MANDSQVVRNDDDRTIIRRQDGTEEVCYHDYTELCIGFVEGVGRQACRICGRPKDSKVVSDGE